ncbi:hypothetical protein CpipJ_CPIJ013824 [Culex quinquefasciatus]|uniref:Uncharacterized protein n=1 Tax=Culex quinquefasciatus TaxID=7176 RepID=B0X2Y4_CULQU|nr:hypothetical protein CpipJ_CPIJ013824 [Culex quinquefasciatus]|eukprot:XP_001864006.1 hypothetical protein CpipJ_CPIJ013824 [Culex quinquefasciatus]
MVVALFHNETNRFYFFLLCSLKKCHILSHTHRLSLPLARSLSLAACFV